MQKVTFKEAVSGFYVHNTWGDPAEFFQGDEFLEAGGFLSGNQRLPWACSIGVNLPFLGAEDETQPLDMSLKLQAGRFFDPEHMPVLLGSLPGFSSVVFVSRESHGLDASEVSGVLVHTGQMAIDALHRETSIAP